MVLLILTLLLSGGYIAYLEFFEKEENTKTVEEKQKSSDVSDNYETLKTDDKIVSDLLGKVSVLKGNLYKGKELTNQEKLQLGFSNTNLSRKEIGVDEFDTVMKQILGPDVVYSNEDTYTDLYDCKYDKNNKKYIITQIVGDGDFGNFAYYAKEVTKVLKYTDRIEIYEKALYVTPGKGSDPYEYVNLYKASVPIIHKVETVDGSEVYSDYLSDEYLIKKDLSGSKSIDEKPNVGEYFDKAETFKYTFKMYDDNYYFYGVEIVNK